ncbi:unnamed protein product [Closterium sp. Yama58-4]|nr:unnamed protein product [Closterium sp. Yama58-4]
MLAPDRLEIISMAENTPIRQHSPDSSLLPTSCPDTQPDSRHDSSFRHRDGRGAEGLNTRRSFETSKLPPRNPAFPGRNAGQADRPCLRRLSSTPQVSNDVDLNGWIRLAQRFEEESAHSASPGPLPEDVDTESTYPVSVHYAASQGSGSSSSLGDSRCSRTNHGSTSLRLSHSETFADGSDGCTDGIQRRHSVSSSLYRSSSFAFDSLTDSQEDQDERCTRCFHRRASSLKDGDVATTVLCVGCSWLDAELACDPSWIDDARSRIGGAALAVVEAQQVAEALSARVGMATRGVDTRGGVERVQNKPVESGRQSGAIVKIVAAAKGWVMRQGQNKSARLGISVE